MAVSKTPTTKAHEQEQKNSNANNLILQEIRLEVKTVF